MSIVLGKPTVPQHWLLDANVLFSEWTRWLMVALAERHNATLYWTPHIENECYRNLVRLGRLHPEDSDLERLALPERLGAVLLPQVHEPYLADVRAVDEKDRHVAASALALKHRLQSPVGLITWNVRDFPRKQLLKLGVVRYSPDELFIELMKGHADLLTFFQQTNDRMRLSLHQHPPKQPTTYQARANPLPEQPEEWDAFLGRNRMHKAARLMAQSGLLPRSG